MSIIVRNRLASGVRKITDPDNDDENVGRLFSNKKKKKQKAYLFEKLITLRRGRRRRRGLYLSSLPPTHSEPLTSLR